MAQAGGGGAVGVAWGGGTAPPRRPARGHLCPPGLQAPVYRIPPGCAAHAQDLGFPPQFPRRNARTKAGAGGGSEASKEHWAAGVGRGLPRCLPPAAAPAEFLVGGTVLAEPWVTLDKALSAPPPRLHCPPQQPLGRVAGQAGIQGRLPSDLGQARGGGPGLPRPPGRLQAAPTPCPWPGIPRVGLQAWGQLQPAAPNPECAVPPPLSPPGPDGGAPRTP